MFWGEVDRIGGTFIKEMTLTLIEFGRTRILGDGEKVGRLFLAAKLKWAKTERTSKPMLCSGNLVRSSVWLRVGGERVSNEDWQEMTLER